jgi:hypothetical protein
MGVARFASKARSQPGALLTDPARQGTVLYVTAEVIRQVAILTQPFIPTSSSKLLDLLGIPGEERDFAALGVPKRVLDTRDPALGGASGKIGAGRTVSIDVGKIVPGDAVATVLSVTATASCQPGYLTVFACGARPPTSNIDYQVGRTTAGMI